MGRTGAAIAEVLRDPDQLGCRCSNRHRPRGVNFDAAGGTDALPATTDDVTRMHNESRQQDQVAELPER